MSDYQTGDTFAYQSVTQGHWVTWTRNALGEWRAGDGRDAVATDADVDLNRKDEASVYTPNGITIVPLIPRCPECKSVAIGPAFIPGELECRDCGCHDVEWRFKL